MIYPVDSPIHRFNNWDQDTCHQIFTNAKHNKVFSSTKLMLKLTTKERGHFMSLVKSSASLISINAFKDIMIISTVVYLGRVVKA